MPPQDHLICARMMDSGPMAATTQIDSSLFVVSRGVSEFSAAVPL
jgi:hypothetical protein